MDQVVLYNGPDTMKSLEKMGISKEKIQKISEKTTYYLNSLDPVSMLNRDGSKEQLGTVNIAVPAHYTGLPDSHSLSEYQMGPDGHLLVASKDYHPELLQAGQDLAELNSWALDELGKLGEAAYDSSVAGLLIGGGLGVTYFLANLGKLSVEGKKLYDNYMTKYNTIVKTTQEESLTWSKNNMGKVKARLKSATGSEQILLRTELLYMVSQTAQARAGELQKEVDKLLSDSKQRVEEIVQSLEAQASAVAHYLSPGEVADILAPYTMEHVWDSGIEDGNTQSAKRYKEGLENFATNLTKVVQDFQSADTDGATSFAKLRGN